LLCEFAVLTPLIHEAPPRGYGVISLPWSGQRLRPPPISIGSGGGGGDLPAATAAADPTWVIKVSGGEPRGEGRATTKYPDWVCWKRWWQWVSTPPACSCGVGTAVGDEGTIRGGPGERKEPPRMTEVPGRPQPPHEDGPAT
jgi:hypothetical protein